MKVTTRERKAAAKTVKLLKQCRGPVKPKVDYDWTERPLMPPRRRNWREGVPQVGVFVRTADGSVIQMVKDKADPTSYAFAMWVISGLNGLDPSLTHDVEAAWRACVIRNIRKKKTK